MRSGRCRVDNPDACAREQTESAERIDMLPGFGVRVVTGVLDVVGMSRVVGMPSVLGSRPFACRQSGRIPGHRERIRSIATDVLQPMPQPGELSEDKQQGQQASRAERCHLDGAFCSHMSSDNSKGRLQLREPERRIFAATRQSDLVRRQVDFATPSIISSGTCSVPLNATPEDTGLLLVPE